MERYILLRNVVCFHSANKLCRENRSCYLRYSLHLQLTMAAVMPHQDPADCQLQNGAHNFQIVLKRNSREITHLAFFSFAGLPRFFKIILLCVNIHVFVSVEVYPPMCVWVLVGVSRGSQIP